MWNNLRTEKLFLFMHLLLLWMRSPELSCVPIWVCLHVHYNGKWSFTKPFGNTCTAGWFMQVKHWWSEDLQRYRTFMQVVDFGLEGQLHSRGARQWHPDKGGMKQAIVKCSFEVELIYIYKLDSTLVARFPLCSCALIFLSWTVNCQKNRHQKWKGQTLPLKVG